MAKRNTTDEHYVNNAEFLKAIIEFKQLVKESKKAKLPPPRIPEFIGECVMKIATGLSYKSNFAKYTYRDEMVGYAIENCLRAIHKFKPSHSKNPFAYFTTIIWYAFLRKMEDEETKFYIRCKEYENSLPDFAGHGNISETYHLFLLNKIEDYENKRARKKKKQDLKKKEKLDQEKNI